MAAMFRDFVEHAVVRGAVAEEAQDDLPSLLVFEPQSRACGDGDASADDTVCSQVVLLQVGDMHGAAPAPAIAGLLAKELGHHPAGVVPFGDGVTMTPVRADDVILRFRGRDTAHCDRFLAEVQMQVAADVAEPVLCPGRLFEAARRQHQFIHLQDQFDLHLSLAFHGSLLFRHCLPSL